MDIQGVLLAGAALAAIIGVPVALFQLRQSWIVARAEAYERLWHTFDDEDQRDLRKLIHERIPNDLDKRPALGNLRPEVLAAVQRTATAMDRIGYLLVRGYLSDDLIFARYLEVIEPLWEKCEPYLNAIRVRKGGGWQFYGPYPSGLPKPARDRGVRLLTWGERAGPDNLYERARAYHQRAFRPGSQPTLGTFSAADVGDVSGGQPPAMT